MNAACPSVVGDLFLYTDDDIIPGQNNPHHGSVQNSPTQTYPHPVSAPASRDAYFSAPSHVQQQQPQSSQPQQQNGYYSQELTLRSGAGTNTTSSSSGGSDASMPYYPQNGYYFMSNNGMHATEQDQSYYKNMFIELGFGEPNPPVPQHGHQAPMTYSHHMQHANYGH